MGLQTPLFAAHQRLGARIVPFGGWDMPLHYGSQVEEHHAVRRDAGLFDVSHMRPVDIDGPDAAAFLARLLANDVARLGSEPVAPGGALRALYSCMLNPAGGVIDDLICYRRGTGYRLVVNAGTADKDVAWIADVARGFQVRVARRDDLAMLAIQGPLARERTAPLLPTALCEPALALAPFVAVEHGDWFVGRTGYTGEDGFEVMLPAADAAALWDALIDAGVTPCGLGARDTLRLEAGMNLYGQDMDEGIDPLASGLGWTVAWEPATRDFIGRAALERLRATPNRPRLVGLLLTGRGVLRAHQPVLVDGQPVGTVTSGGFGPTLGRSIALARVSGLSGLQAGTSPGTQPGAVCAVEIRGQPVAARVVKPPFVRHGAVLIEP